VTGLLVGLSQELVTFGRLERALTMDELGIAKEQDASTTSKPSLLATIVRYGVKGALGLSLVVAGAALAQNVGLAPPKLKPVEEKTIDAPSSADLSQAPAPGSRREAKACSDDIKTYCAAQTITRRDVFQCFDDKASLISPSCNAYLQRIQNEDAEQ
jgi:hypothetical protein